MYRYDWSDLASTTVIDALYAHVATPAPADRSVASQLLAMVLTHVGGLPLSAADLDANARTALALRFVDDACYHVLGRVWGTDTTAGFHLRPERTLPFDQQVIAHAPVPVNTAEARDLEFLPAIGAALAARIVAERRAHGAYGSATELASRVHGIGDAAAAQLSHALSFTQPWTPRRAAASTPGERFAQVASLATASTTRDPVIAALELLCAVCGQTPHPATTDAAARFDSVVPSGGLAVDWIAPLAGETYHAAVASLIDSATSAVRVCMFHIAMGTDAHPTLQLLERLAAAKGRGLEIRVLLDQDRKDDPYNSTVINRRAKEWLEARGVAVRFDAPHRLLHSKFVVIDASVVVVGSHNWSIGSFHEYDDLSLAIKSPGIVQDFTSRFEALWLL